MKNLSKRQRYYLKQKLMGLVMVLTGIVTLVLAIAWSECCFMPICIIGLGLYAVCTKEPLYLDNEYYYIKRNRQRKRRRL